MQKTYNKRLNLNVQTGLLILPAITQENQKQTGVHYLLQIFIETLYKSNDPISKL